MHGIAPHYPGTRTRTARTAWSTRFVGGERYWLMRDFLKALTQLAQALTGLVWVETQIRSKLVSDPRRPERIRS
jgi:hypothetical protein